MLLSLRFLQELVVDFGDVLLALGSTSVEGTDVQEAVVPFPLSDELLGTFGA